MAISKDKRDVLWKTLEGAIQMRSKNKDPKFLLRGKWKKFVRKHAGYKIYEVDGAYIRNNICAYFGHGGHGLVHEFIPMDEIWISARHYSEGKHHVSNCYCLVRKKNQLVSKKYFESTVLHEMVECEEMKKGKSYWIAHNIALAAEKKAGFLIDPFDDME